MDVVKTYLVNFDALSDGCKQLYDIVIGKISQRYVYLPVTGLVLFYLVFVREISGKKRKRVDKKPCNPDEEYTGDERPNDYPDMPILDGWLKITIAKRLYKTYIGDVLLRKNKKAGGLDLPSNDIPETATFHPFVFANQEMLNKAPVNDEILLNMVSESTSSDDRFGFNTISDYIQLYREGKMNPTEVATNVMKAIKESQHLKSIIEMDGNDVLKMANESTERWQNGTQLSIFDGIPIAIKDEYIVGGYHLRNGFPMSSLDHIYDQPSEGGLVKKLRAGGAVFIGITNMHQCGIGAFGINPSKHHGANRNPYNPKYAAGGSSGGSASAIAAGYCPVALGTDGGGSIRIPASACGVVGLKATYGRYTSSGMFSNGQTIGHTGPLCCSVRDTALAYGYLAGKDENDEKTLLQPPVHVGDFDNTDLSGFKIGFDPQTVEHCHPEIKVALLKAIETLKEKHNATVVDIHIPEKAESMRALAKILGSEMSNSNEIIYCNHADELNIDVMGSLKLGRSITADEYLTCSRQRTRCINGFKYIFTKVDCIILPGFEEFLPEITKSREKYGYSHSGLTMRVASIGMLCNLSGIPAISIPMGYNQTHRFPLPMQIMAPWWREDTLLRVAHSVESNVKKERPEVYFDVLKD